MNTCAACRESLAKGSPFCTSCGSSLIPQVKTSSLHAAGGSSPLEPPSSEVLQISVSRRASKVRLTIVNTGRKLFFFDAQRLLLGRADLKRGFRPEIDLTEDGGAGAGVSRRHSRLTFSGGYCFIEDLGSTNGTCLNGRRLAPFTLHPLHSSDEIKLGTITIQVELPVDGVELAPPMEALASLSTLR